MSVVNYVNPSKISKYLYCDLCHCIYNKPTRIRCGHTFCYQCLMKYLQNSFECPKCGAMFTENSMQKDLIAFNMINDLDVYCSNKGCQWKSKKKYLNLHLKKCYYDPIKLPEFIKKILFKVEIKNEKRRISSFNTNVSLKARKIHKNKKNIFNSRDTIMKLNANE